MIETDEFKAESWRDAAAPVLLERALFLRRFLTICRKATVSLMVRWHPG